MSKKKLFTSESGTEGHPDKVCDQISDAVLDAVLAQDPSAHVACETCVTTGMVLVMGEVTTNCYVDIPGLVRNVVKEIGYDNAAKVAKKAHKENLSLKEACLDLGFMSEEEFDKVFHPEELI